MTTAASTTSTTTSLKSGAECSPDLNSTLSCKYCPNGSTSTTFSDVCN